MRTTTSVTEVLRNFSDYISRVIYRGERFVLTRGGREVAELVPTAPAGRPLSELEGVLASLPELDADEAARFADDLDRARREGAASLPGDPWAS